GHNGPSADTCTPTASSCVLPRPAHLAPERAEREYQECLAYLEQIKVSHEDHHRQTWELHQRAKDVSDLQSALSEANTRLLAERRQLLDVLRENDELKVKELNDRRKIRYLLTQVKPPDDETTYFKERLHKRFVKTAEQEERAPDIYTVVLDGASLGRRDPAAEAPGAQTVDEETLVPPGPSSGAAPAGGHGAGGPEGGSRSGIPRTQRQVRVSRMTQKSGAGSSGSPLPASVRAAQPGGGGARAGSSGSQLPAFARASHPGGGGAPPFPSHRAATSSRPASAPSPTRGSKTAPANAHRPAARSVADDDEDEYASEGSDLYDAREEIDHLKLTVKALRAQLAEQVSKTLLEDTVNAYAQDRQARQEEEAARKRNDAAKIEEHIEKLVRTKHALQAAERKYREEKAKLTEEVAELSRKLTEERGRNDTVETVPVVSVRVSDHQAVEVRVSKKSENLVAELRYQLGKSEEDMIIFSWSEPSSQNRTRRAPQAGCFPGSGSRE
ncbi:MAG: hypothetical protein BJ554DRAFT_5968, partial [Olpidium bornovanus]